jgi:hypothetical protein
VPREPDVERLDAAVELVDVVAGGERLRLSEAWHLLRARTTQQVHDRRLDLRRPIERRSERLPGLLVEDELSS